MRGYKILLLLPALIPGVVTAQHGKVPVGSLALDQNGYRRELNRWTAAAVFLGDHPSEAAALRRRLPESWTVTTDGQSFQIPLDWLRAKLFSVETHTLDAGTAREDIRKRLQAMRDEADALSEPSWFESAAARKQLDEILSRREFRSVHGPTGLDRATERVRAWLEDLIDRLVQPLQGHPRAGKVLLWILALVPVLALAVWLVRWVLYRPALPSFAVRESAPIKTSWQGYLREARMLSAQGDFRGAVRLAYWAGIHRLGELGVWHVDRARTHREYLRLLRANDPNRDAFSDLTLRFENAWYAGTTAAREDFQSALSQVEKLGCLPPSIPATGR
jgi:hypothetical protein